MINLELLSQSFFCNGYDVPYNLKKGDSISIKPILVKDYMVYEWCLDVMEIKKNEINDIELIKMSYLEFLISYVFKSNDKYEYKLREILHLSLGADYIAFTKDKGRYCIAICDESGTVKSIINHKEFDEIICIILNQNNPNYDNRYINPEVRDMLSEYYKIKYSDINSPSFEKRKAFVCSKIGKTFKEINEMTCREFELIYRASIDSEIYLATKVTEASYKYEVKKQTIHPLFEKDKDPYAEAFEDSSILASKGISGAEQLNALNLIQNK